MDDFKFQNLVAGGSNFELRRAVERLREGLFDPLGVQMLTSGGAKLDMVFNKGVTALDRNQSSHLCICGAYGQGKSHSLTYIKQRALADNFVVSHMNLDPRQVPFHNFQAVYRAVMAGMEFPHGEKSIVPVWKKGVERWLSLSENGHKNCLDLIPRDMPHRFKAILTAMASPNMVLSARKRQLKKHARFKPREFSWILKNALLGKEIPAWRLSAVFRYRQVPFYKDHSLVCKDPAQYLAMVKAMAALFQGLGFKGWVILFDEGESIAQTRITSRSKSYELLHKMFCPDAGLGGFYPVFAFTHDFFSLVSQEAYDRTRIFKGGKNGSTHPLEIPLFKRDYHYAWKDITIHSLHDLASAEWKILIRKLIVLHARAYGWTPEVDLMQKKMVKILSRHAGAEPRLKLRLLVNHLDLEQQTEVVDSLIL
jgi:hypothetical protein